MLELDLGFRHNGVSAIVIGKVDDTVANALGGTELPVVVVARDYVDVVTRRKATGRREVRGDDFLFRDRCGDDGWMEASFVGGPYLFHLKVNITKKHKELN